MTPAPIQRGIIYPQAGAAPMPTVVSKGIRAWPDDPGGAELEDVAMAAGETLAVAIFYDVGNIITSATWNGNPLTLIVGREAVNYTLEIWALANTPAGTGLVNFFFEQQVNALLAAAAISNMAVAPLDQSTIDDGNGNSPSSGNTPNTAQAIEALFGAVITEGPESDNPGAWSGGFTALDRLGFPFTPQTGDCTLSTGYRVVSAVGPYAAAKTGVTARAWGAGIATFKGA